MESLLYTLLIGFLAGALASWVMKASYAWWVDIILGIIGAFVGTWILGVLGVGVGGGLLSTILVAAFGAVIIIAIVRFAHSHRGGSPL